jgi:AcrR family transcriptional regulator
MVHVTATRPERRRGRRPGGADTRTALLDAARVEFAERGYEGATVRRIAERAGVDAAMVNHWFGGKEALFAASIDLPISPAEIHAQVVRECITKTLIGPVVTTVAPDAPTLRGTLVASQLIGLGLARYVLQLEPLASADHAAVVAAVAPNLQRFLTGPLDALPAP